MAQLQIRGNTQIKIGTVTADRLAFNPATQVELDAVVNGVIATNTANIATNTGNISANTTAIASANTAIGVNTTDIATNLASINTLNTNVASNTAAIAVNTTDIATNATAIAANLGSSMQKAANLGDVVDVVAARTNLGVDSSTTVDTKINNAGLALGSNYSVADIAARDALTGLTVWDNVFVTASTGGTWETFKVTSVWPVVFQSIMTEALYANANSAASIKASYESNPNTNAFTDADVATLAALGTVNSIYGEQVTVAPATNTVTLANVPTLIKGVYLNGLRTKYYTSAGAVITMTDLLEAGDEIYVDYNY